MLRPTRVWVILLLLLIPIQALSASAQLSPTMDEGAHLSSGYAGLVTGRFRTVIDHPPLARQLAALPLLIVKRQVPPDIYEWNHLWNWPDQIATPGVDNIDWLFFWGRLPIALLAALLGWVVYRWAADLAGPGTGLLALFILAFDPNVLALSGLVTTDIAAATFVTLALYRLWRLARQPTGMNIVWAGIALGLAQVAKFSALFLVPLVPVLIFLVWLIPTLNRRFGRYLPPVTYPRRSLAWYAGSVLAIFAIAALVIWADYGFEMGRLEGLKRQDDVDALWLPNRVPEPYRDLVRNLPIPAPTYIKGLRIFLPDATGAGYTSFVAGQYSETGFWYYFPLAFVLKTPVPTLLLLGLGLLYSIRRFYRCWPDDLFLLLPAAAYAAGTLWVHLNLGYRHLLPLLALLFVLAGRDAIASRGRRWLSGLVVALCIWLVLDSAHVWPNYLAYFNQFAGGPANGYHWLVDSNVDWGQDLRNLKTYMDQHGLKRVKLSYFGSVSPAFYGIEYDCLPSFGVEARDGCPPWAEVKIEPGVYVISATNLQGSYLPDRDAFAWFRNRTPTARIGYSLFVYEVTGRE